MIVVEARPEDSQGVARVHVDAWRCAYRGQVADEYLDGLDYPNAERTGPAAIARGAGRGVFMFVAKDDVGTVVGFAVGGNERGECEGFSGELHALYVSPNCQKSGVGRMLVKAVARRLLDQGYESMVVWTLINNAARGFYERLGGRFVATGEILIGGEVYEKVAYGWSDIRVLTDS